MLAPYSANNRLVAEPIASLVAALLTEATLLFKSINFSKTDPICPVCISSII